MPRSNNYFYSAESLNWEIDHPQEPVRSLTNVEDSQELKQRLIKEMAAMMGPKIPAGPRAYRWEASLPGGGMRITGKLVVDDETMTEDLVRMRSYQKFARHVEVEAASPGTLACYHVSPKGKRVHVGYFPSGASGLSGNVHVPTAMKDMERYVAVYVSADREGQLELDLVEKTPRGPEINLAIVDEIQLMPRAEEDVAGDPCASGCGCPLEGRDVADTGTELEL